jgi:shikimate kinase
MNKPIFLVGFMGSGKSHVGIKLADFLYCPFTDLDQQIEGYSKKSIRRIFAEEGEAWFRLLERRALHNITYKTPGIIATGGGTPCFFDNIEWMNNRGIVIFLDTSEEVLLQRLWKGRTKRPLLNGFSPENLQDFIHQKMKERRPFYEKASVHYVIKHHEQATAEDITAQISAITGH